MCEQRVNNVWKSKARGKKKKENKKNCFVYLQCSSGKLSPERREQERKMRLEIQQEHFPPDGKFYSLLCYWIKQYQKKKTNITQLYFMIE